MANAKNLIPNSERTPEQLREMASAGGKASGAARRRKRSLREAADVYLSLPVSDRQRWNRIASCGVDPEDVDNQMAIPYLNTVRPVPMSDIPEEYRDIAEAIGLEAFTQLTLLCGGQSLYIPKRESLERNARDRDIRARFNGCNYRALAAQFRLSERQIRKIINGTRT